MNIKERVFGVSRDMIGCANCKNRVICKSVELSKEINKDVEELKDKYKDFFGKIVASCDYFITDRLERGIK